MRIGPLGIWEILIILVVILVVFGPRRLPEMAKGIGQSVREFRKGIRDMRDEFHDEAAAEPKVASRAGAAPERSTGPDARPTPDVTTDAQATEAEPPPTPV